MPMLSPADQYNIKADLDDFRNDYRELQIVYPNFTSGSNYEAFTDSPYNISADRDAYLTATSYQTYRCLARIKIYQDISLYGMGQIFPGIELGDYLIYFKREDYEQLKRMYNEKHAYMSVDGVTLRPNGFTATGVFQNYDISAHCKKYSPRFVLGG